MQKTRNNILDDGDTFWTWIFIVLYAEYSRFVRLLISSSFRMSFFYILFTILERYTLKPKNIPAFVFHSKRGASPSFDYR